LEAFVLIREKGNFEFMFVSDKTDRNITHQVAKNDMQGSSQKIILTVVMCKDKFREFMITDEQQKKKMIDASSLTFVN